MWPDVVNGIVVLQLGLSLKSKEKFCFTSSVHSEEAFHDSPYCLILSILNLDEQALRHEKDHKAKANERHD